MPFLLVRPEPEYQETVNQFPLLGAVIGQLFMGLICDRFGRKVALMGTTMLVVVGYARPQA